MSDKGLAWLYGAILLSGGCSSSPLPAGMADLAAPPDLAAPADLAPAADLLQPPDLAPAWTTVLVRPQSPKGWVQGFSNTAAGEFVPSPEPAPLGLGGFRLQSGSGSGPDLGGKAWLLSDGLRGTSLSSLRRLRYRTLVRAGSTAAPQLGPSLNLQVDVDGDGLRDTTLVFEPVYAPEQGAVQKGAWQTWDAIAGKWWTTVATAAFCAAGCPFTLQGFVAAHGRATIVDWDMTPGFAFLAGQRSGGAWANFDGDVDALELDSGAGVTTYDFEPEADACRDNGYTRSRDPLFASEEQCVAYHSR